jgi:hypothetical protein
VPRRIGQRASWVSDNATLCDNGDGGFDRKAGLRIDPRVTGEHMCAELILELAARRRRDGHLLGPDSFQFERVLPLRAGRRLRLVPPR